jgi:hypothetical protein
LNIQRADQRPKVISPAPEWASIIDSRGGSGVPAAPIAEHS